MEIYRTPEEKREREMRGVNEQIEGLNKKASEVEKQSEKLVEDSGEALKRIVANLELEK